MTVRIPDDSARQIDKVVSEGLFPSRAAYLDWLVRKEAMRQRALADLVTLREAAGDGDPYPELDWVAESSTESLGLD